VLRGVDRAAFAVALTQRLRRAGVPVGLTGVDDFVRALGIRLPRTTEELYWVARITLLKRQEDIGVLDDVLAGGRTATAEISGPGADERAAGAATAGGGDEAGAGLPWVTLPPVAGATDDNDADLTMPHRLASALEQLADRPFEELDAAELAALADWLRVAVRDWPVRRTRRQAADPAGHRIAVRPTIARARRTGWEPIHLVRVKPVRRPRRVVMLCDVSQSMQAQVPAYRVLMTALAEVADAETFTFATRLTRGTTDVPDRFGGTRIATNVKALVRGHGDLLRGAVVLIASDGWDSDPPADLAAAMARLRRLAYRVVWLNPRAGAPGFEPRVAAMAAALPYCDTLLPADTFRSLRDALSSITSRGSRGGTGRP
jgi:uncharacterized protein with von Willebrand factor type A (vWA) domain